MPTIKTVVMIFELIDFVSQLRILSEVKNKMRIMGT
jgi:hypothetical protein